VRRARAPHRPLPRGGRRPRPGALLAGVLAALALGGCGLAIGNAPSAVQLLVTSEFGGTLVRRSGALKAHEGETVRSLLASLLPVRGGADGHPVASIGGLAAGGSGSEPGQPREWFYFVNGVQIEKAPSRREVHPGDHIWWDLHDASQTRVPRAVVGAYPQPFLDGTEGKRLPVRVECASVSAAPCTTVTESLRRVGVPAAVAAIGSGGAPETLRVMVGPWVYLAGDLEAQSIAHGPRESGVYVRIPASGGQLTLLDEQGRAVRSLSGDAGLVAATTATKEAPVWVITGTDEAGVELAAGALNATALADHFALALTPRGAVALPVQGGAGARR
jgi:hypothetical protein